MGHFASVTADNGAHVVPCCFVLDDDTLYWAVDDVKPKSTHALRRVRNIEANPRVRVKVSGPNAGWRSGTGHILDDDDPRRNTT